MNGYREFEFDLPEALLSSLVECFDLMSGANLVPENVRDVPDAQGVYQLLLKDRLVYIGKTDGEAGLRSRLSRHSYTIQQRKNLDVTDVTFKAIRVFVFTAVDLETQLIRYYSQAHPVSWNNKGFGSNDPGRNRDDTQLNIESFDALYPLDIDRELQPLDLAGSVTMGELVSALRASLPFTFRYETSTGRRPHLDFETTTLLVPQPPYSLRELLVHAFKHLPSGWQATRLAGRVIVYREIKDYVHGETIARS